MRRWRSRRSLTQRSIHNTMTWRLPRLAKRRNYNGIKLFSEPRPVDAKCRKVLARLLRRLLYLYAGSAVT